jgi:Hemerythrin HHE cation binding domain
MTHEPRADARDMFVVHAMFRREFGLMPGLVPAVAAGDSARAALVADHVALMSEGLAAHHQGEDDHIWPVLRGTLPRGVRAARRHDGRPAPRRPRSPGAGGEGRADGGTHCRVLAERVANARAVCPGHSRYRQVVSWRPQQDSNLRSRLRRRQTTSFEFAYSACLDSVTYTHGGRDRSAHIPDHEHFRRDRPHRAGDGPRPVRAGSRLSLVF